ncbi:ABC transporter ATP-binding protein [Testudinibacter sp. TR-2022]|uniref:ABC transporter ATP-binding protein n=1 Tax=Testudinibacter sp. TR-2022 TaxID=2585029 RepID=UPI00111A2AD1|nr:ABC transporter ATP-binding protein [Testudinibacter sp. TR-2022]TNH06230.1 ABC transporter ATP-binding protein [Pasteurellaceae bacterium Phil11]TNH23147.1 ABC transporter ATP-binding protein [Testudinibacter sp. TR-2022]TNH25390.1 ABC transporter ATP-binding protein [Testudinibacter sp. TR-2022]
MSYNYVINIDHISKSYRTYKNEWQRFARWFGADSNILDEKKILKNITFRVMPGESIGIIGQNGAGKSTLLKLITGTSKPTEGKITINGRISAILELGMGFNPDLTGRQNVYHSASLMGFSKEEIDRVIDDIEAFAEVGEYFDQPIRVYSSGMQVRVAFAVATAWRPEVLIIDEALSVGDSYFQHKSFNRIREFQNDGSTLLIVSHDRGAIQALCNRAILIEKGNIIKDGNPEEIFDFYNALIAEKENSIEITKLSNGATQTKSGTGEATVDDITLVNHTGNITDIVKVGENVELRIQVSIHKDIENLVLGIGIKDRLGQVMYGTNTWHTKQIVNNVKAGEQYSFNISFQANLGVGSYSLQTALHDRDTHLNANYEWKDYALIFEVINSEKFFFVGSQWLDCSFNIDKINNN